MPAQTKEGLKRVIGARALAANIVNITIGAGIYVLPAIIAIQVGTASILEYLFCAVMLISIMLCYAEIGSKITNSGGSYVYVEAVFGPFAGFIVNWLFVVGWGSAGSAALMNVIADSLATLFPIFSLQVTRVLLFLALTVFFIVVNARGAKGSVRLVEWITLFKLIPLAAIIVFGFSQVKASNLHWEHLPAIKTFGETALVLFYAFAGFETALNSSGEVENPKHAIPRGILLGGGLVFIAYLIIQVIVQGALGSQIDTFKDAPLAAVAEKIVGPAGAIVLLIAAIVSSFGVVAGDVLASPRLLFAGANDGLFPKFLGKVHPKFATPYPAIISYASLIFIFSISGGFKKLAILASGSLLLIYLGVVLAMIGARFKKGLNTGQGFRAPGGLVLPVIAVIAIIWLLSHLSPREIIATAGFIVIGSAIYLLMKLVKQAYKNS